MNAARLLPPAVLVVIGLTFVAGTLLEDAGVELGTTRPPFLFDVDPQGALGWALLAAAALALALLAAPRLLALPPVPFALALLGLTLVLRLAVGAVRFGPDGLDAPFEESFEAQNEYLYALPALRDGLGWFLDRFAELVPALPVHAAGHPPGLLVVMDVLGITSPEGLTALLIGGGALAVPLTYALARRLLEEDRARFAGLLAAFATGTVLYGATTADALFATLGALAAVLLVDRRRARTAAGAVALAVGVFFSYALLAIGAWAALVRLRRDGVRDALVLSVACAVALVGGFAALWLATGFELPAAVAATDGVYEDSVARLRPYWFWVVGSPVAFLAFTGLPITWYATCALALRDTAALALAAVVLVSTLGGFTKAETERIWLMYVPLACVAAGAVLPRARLVPVLALLCLQTLAFELVFGTVW